MVMKAKIVRDEVRGRDRVVRVVCTTEDGRRYEQRWNHPRDVGDERVKFHIRNWMKKIKPVVDDEVIASDETRNSGLENTTVETSG